MIENLVMMASFNGAFGSLFQKWQEMGIIDFLLPFLIIFCLVFITLKSLKLFKENVAITSIISLAVGLMAMSLDFVPTFFKEVFPRMGVGLVIILVAMILVGLFADFGNAYVSWGFFIGAVIIAIITFSNTASAVGWNWGLTWNLMNGEFFAGLVLVVIIGLAIGMGKTGTTQPLNNPLKNS